ncbi:guanylate-binding protein 1-like [Misgurnus anguillicaudatus]|uniref:guanylate-binding protein 1-like n=1 Tax=Misgurnus anguillicaudatus TaxID=75329 RepID=UPI003CCF3B2E
MDIYYEALLAENETASEKKCKELLKNLFSDMSKRLQNGAYSQPGGYEDYCRDRDAIIAQYRGEPNKGVRAEAVLNEFMNERGPEANIILCTDKKLSENDRKIQVERQRRLLLEHHRFNLEQLMEKQRLEEERMRQENERIQEAKLRVRQLINSLCCHVFTVQ